MTRKLKRAAKIILRSVMGVYSPSLCRKVKISDIWETPGYEREVSRNDKRRSNQNSEE